MNPQHAIVFRTAILLLAAGLQVACGGPTTAITRPTMATGRALDAGQLFERACAACHGPLGRGGLSGVPLNGMETADRPMIIDAIRHGVGGMPASSDSMSDEQINALADYVVGLR